MTVSISAATLETILGDASLSSYQKILLLALESHVGKQGEAIYPSLRRLATLSSLSLAYICELLPALEARGYLTIKHRQGPKGSNAYVLRYESVPQRGAPQRDTRSRGAPQRRTELRTEGEKEQVLFHSVEYHSVEHVASLEHGSVDPRLDSVLRQKRANLIREWELDAPFHAACLGDTAEPTPAPASPTQTPAHRTPRGAGLYRLGKLCKRGHAHEGTGQSLRRLPSGSCLQCDLERQEEKRQAQVQAKREAKPPRHIIDLAAHRQKQG
jgi:hypothetical protein